jgi:ubiquitin-like 1-activating enzyme E1 B
MEFNADADIKAYHQNIKDPSFNVTFFSKYTIVLNALDNVDARRHVNRLCLASNIPLIESGTTGYIGQVMPIMKGHTECYECRPKVTQKVYPICTIRSTPDKPVHCIVWAKELFKLIFGNTSESLLYEPPEGAETSTFMPYITLPTDTSPTSVAEYSKKLLTSLFITEVQKQIDMGVYKTSSCIPTVVSQDTIQRAAERLVSLGGGGGGAVVRPSAIKGWERVVWTDEDCLLEMMCCSRDFLTLPSLTGLVGSCSFEKDDKTIMTFVAAASLIRSRIFHIEGLCYHDAKGVAGNIIPAIASTNAIIAGLQVAAAMSIVAELGLGGHITKEQCRLTFCQRQATRRGFYLQPTPNDGPSPDCYVCGSSQVILEVLPPLPLSSLSPPLPSPSQPTLCYL